MSANKEVSFEKKLERLNEIVSLVEGGKLPLEEMMKLVEEGAALASDLDITLSDAEKKIAGYKKVTENGTELVK